jgi:hypothetical protein
MQNILHDQRAEGNDGAAKQARAEYGEQSPAGFPAFDNSFDAIDGTRILLSGYLSGRHCRRRAQPVNGQKARNVGQGVGAETPKESVFDHHQTGDCRTQHAG